MQFRASPAVNLPNDRHASLEKSTFNTLSRWLDDVNVTPQEVFQNHEQCSLTYLLVEEDPAIAITLPLILICSWQLLRFVSDYHRPTLGRTAVYWAPFTMSGL